MSRLESAIVKWWEYGLRGGYSPILQVVCHWLVAKLIVSQYKFVANADGGEFIAIIFAIVSVMFVGVLSFAIKTRDGYQRNFDAVTRAVEEIRERYGPNRHSIAGINLILSNIRQKPDDIHPWEEK